MLIEHLALENFRRITKAELTLAPGANLFVGENAQGKTSILEAVNYIATGRSFRTQRDRECIAFSESKDAQPYAAAECRYLRHDDRHRIRVAISDAGKSVWLDGKTLPRLADLWGQLNVVVLLPSDLELVRGAPGQRRNLLDNLLAQVSRYDLAAMQSYGTALRQRNAILKSSRPDWSQCEVFEAEMAKHGARLARARERLTQRLAPLVSRNLTVLAGGRDQIELRHAHGWPKHAQITLDPEPKGSADSLAAQFKEWWKSTRESDRDRGTTQHGPHRADLAFQLDGQDARAYASQGQARTIVLALRLAEMEALEGVLGEPPILLLDDVLGELDQGRARHFLRLVAGKGLQALLTATDATIIESEIPLGARFRVHEGKIARPHSAS